MGSPEASTVGPVRYVFGEFTLNLDEGFLRRGADEVALRPKPFEVLVYLVTHHGRLVSKRELTEAVWPDTAVMDNSLAQCLVDIRRALGDESQTLIRTVSRRGYIFTAPVTAPVVEFPQRVAVDASARAPVAVAPPTRTHSSARDLFVGLCLFATVLAASLTWILQRRVKDAPPTYTQLTNFTDSAQSPALSPDGKMLAFIRSDNWFLTPDQIYFKLLPDGEPIRVTNDPRPKYAPTFTPDGSRIIYSVALWSTYVVSALGGEPTLFLSNSSGVTWLPNRRILFSEVNPPRSVHMGVVTANEDRSDQRTIYFPRDTRGMVHLSYASPDGRWVLVLEMNPVWQPCRVVPLDGRSSGRQVGPAGACTSAAWSPDGKWMYFGVDVNGAHHLWRQRFPDGQPEQITFGATEEDGIAVAPDGRSLITSIGMRQGVVWIHDVRGDRPLSSQGYVPDPEVNGRPGSGPVFSRDGALLYYLKSESSDAPTELWRADVRTESSEKLLRATAVVDFEISDDEREVVYSAAPRGERSQVWVAPLDRRSAPRLIAASGEDSPHFGPNGQIVFRSFDGTNHYLEQIDRDGSARSKVVPYPIGNTFFMSPNRKWITAVTTLSNGIGGTYAVPLAGGAPQRICSGCTVGWSPDGGFLYAFVQKPSFTESGKTRVFRLRPGQMLPKLPSSGMRAPAGPDDPAVLPDSALLNVYGISPSPDPAVYAYVKTAMHRNLFRVPIP